MCKFIKKNQIRNVILVQIIFFLVLTTMAIASPQKRSGILNLSPVGYGYTSAVLYNVTMKGGYYNYCVGASIYFDSLQWLGWSFEITNFYSASEKFSAPEVLTFGGELYLLDTSCLIGVGFGQFPHFGVNVGHDFWLSERIAINISGRWKKYWGGDNKALGYMYSVTTGIKINFPLKI